MSHDENIIATGRAPALANYPHVRRAGGFLFVSGTSSRRADGGHDGVTLHPDGRVELDIRAQTRAVIENIAALLERAGASLGDLVDLTTFLVDVPRDYAGYNEVYDTFFDAHSGPARTTVGVAQLPHPNLLIEIKAVALDPLPRDLPR